MLAPAVEFSGFTHDDWDRVLSLFRPRRPDGRPRAVDRPRGFVVAIHDGQRVRKLIHSRVGRLRLDDIQERWPVGPEELARQHDASWSLIIRAGALETVMEQLGANLRPHHSTTEQWLLFIDLVRYQLLQGGVEMWPARFAGVPLPSPAMVDATLDSVCPVGKSMLIGLFEDDALWSCIALRRGSRGFNLVLGPDSLRPRLGLLSGDFRRDHRHLARAVTDRAGPLSLGCFAEAETFRQLEVDPTPGAWALAVATRDVVLAPVPAGLTVPLGIDAGRAALGALRQMLHTIDPEGTMLASRLEPTVNAIVSVAFGDRSVEELLGFHPLDLLRRLLSRDG
ncbi:MAG: hypothetical protein AAGA56_06135 [Myxococcota bacterium]